MSGADGTRGFRFEPGADLGLCHRGVARLVKRPRQFAAQACAVRSPFGRGGALLVELAQRAPLGRLDYFQNKGHLIAGAFQLGRELGPQLCQLATRELQFPSSSACTDSCA